jgi:hypothetical protein
MAADILGSYPLDAGGLARATALIDLHREVRIATSSTVQNWGSLPIGSDIETTTVGGRKASAKRSATGKPTSWLDGDEL